MDTYVAVVGKEIGMPVEPGDRTSAVPGCPSGWDDREARYQAMRQIVELASELAAGPEKNLSDGTRWRLLGSGKPKSSG